MKKGFAVALVTILIVLLVAGAYPQSYPMVPMAAWPQGVAAAAELPAVAAAPTSSAPHNPIVLDQKPAPEEETPADAPVTLTFDQKMDTASVEASFTITPTVSGKISWDENKMVFTPVAGALARGATYRVMLAETAKSADGLPLAKPIDFRFHVVGYLEVAEVMPAPDTAEVDMDSTVTVIFDRPVVPLTSLGQQAGLPQPLTFTPSVMGKGEWLNTSIYTFKPDIGFLPATKYKARIAAGLADAMGGTLKEDYTWQFTTKLPAVTRTIPGNKAVYVGPSDPVALTFNQPMNHASAEGKFSLEARATGDMVTGRVEWSTGEISEETSDMGGGAGEKATSTMAVKGETMTFIPDQPLELGTVYMARLRPGAKAAQGEGVTTLNYAWMFTTVSLPAVKRTTPQNGERAASSYDGVTFVFTSPMSPTSFTAENVRVIPEPTSVYSYWSNSYTDWNLTSDLKPSTAYTVTLSKDILGRYGHKLGKDYTIHFTTKQADPSLVLINQGSIGTYSSYTDTMAYVSYRNVSELTYHLYSLSVEEFFNLTGEDKWQFWQDFKPKASSLIRTWAKSVTAPLNEYRLMGSRLAATRTGGLAPGLYWLEVSAPGASTQRQAMAVSPYNIVLKQSQQSAMVWVTDLKTGAVVPDLDVRLYGDKGNLLSQGRTDKDGVYQGTYEKVDPWSTMYVLTGDEKLPSANFGAVVNKWSDGISAWDFNINSEQTGQDYSGYLYTDRPIYRPGQKVYFKGIIRQDDWARYSLPPAGQAISVTVSNGEGEEIYNDGLTLNAMGTFHGELSLGESTSLGFYSLSARLAAEGQSFGANFQVAEYRKPQFQVSLTTDKPEYLNGDKIAVQVKSEYYFGGPVPNAKVHWSVTTEDASFNYTGKGWYDFTDYDWTQGRYYGGWGGLVTEGDGRTDAKGEFTFSVPADIADKINSQRYTIEASVTDSNDQEVSTQAVAIVHKGLFYIGLAPQAYVGTANKEANIDVLTVDWESQPSPNISVTLVYNEHEWFSVEEKSEDGSFYWTSKYVDTPVFTETVQTDSEGKAVGTFVPEKGGIYRIVATAMDERENAVRSGTFLWVTSEEFVNWRQENNDRIELVADKKSYKVGDTAEVLIPSPYQGDALALLTIERGRVLSHQLITLKGNSEKVSIPILPDYTPDVFVSVVLVKGPDKTMSLASFKLGYVMLTVSKEGKELKVTLKPDKEQYQPGDTVTYDVQTTDYQGKGKPAELSLNLVDKSVLALADSTQGTLMDHFWGQRGVGVQTAASLVLSVDRRNLEVAPAAKGGGGGGPGGEGTVRRRFPDTAYWNPVVETDADGKAQVKVQLPDTLTTWNMSAKAVTVDTEVGESAVDVRSTKPLHIRSILPRFFVVGDRAQVGAVIHNETEAPFEVSVDLSGDGVEIKSKNDKLEVPAHGQTEVRWDVTVTGDDSARLRFSTRGAGLSDAEEFTLPVLRYTSPETVATAGQVGASETRTEMVQLPPRMDPTQGELKLEIDPSLAAGTRDGLTYLETYPYLCIEQTVSRFLPNVMTYRALKDLGISNPDLEAKVPTYVTIGLQRLYSLQHTDGGWGWWLADESNPFLTAYVLFGLNQTKEAGFVVEPNVIDQAVNFLQESLKKPADVRLPYSGNVQAFILYALADAGEGDMGRTVALFKRRETLSNYGKALLALALHTLDPEVKTRTDALLSDLNNAAVMSATGAHWEEATTDYWTMSTNNRSTSIVLEALVKIKPDSKLIPNVVRWLMVSRKDGHWESTQETAWALMALTDYMVASGELKADYSYKVLLNGKSLTEGTVDAENLSKPEFVQVAAADLLRDVSNQVSFVRLPPAGSQTGEGQLYYSMFLRYFLPVPEIKALNRGVILARQYALVDEPGKLVDGAKVGDVMQVRLTIVAPSDLHYLVVEDPLPAGCEALDQSLKITSQVGQRPELKRADTGVDQWGWGWWWFSHTEVRDDKVALFATYLPKGTYEYTYLMRASLPGEFRVMPSTAYQMYFPEVFGRGDGGMFTVAPAED